MDWSTLKEVSAVIAAAFAAATFFWAVIWAVATKMWKVATKKELQSLKEELERDINALKTDTERDADSMKDDIKDEMKEIRQDYRVVSQNHVNHLNDHANPASPKHQTLNEGSGPPSFEQLSTPQKGDFITDDDNKRTGS